MAELKLPYRDRDQPLDADALDLPRHLDDPQERRIVTQIVCQAMSDGVQTVGDLLDRFERASPAERRELVDQARGAAGLPSIGRAEAEADYDRRLAAPREEPRDSRGRAPAFCHAENCTAFEADPSMPGVPAMTTAKRWCCASHRDEGDFTPWTGPRLAFGPSGAIVDLDEQEREADRERTAAENRRRRREAEQLERRAAAQASEANERAVRDRHRREAPDAIWEAMIP